MQLYANANGQKQLPFPKGRGTCPCCGGVLIAKCGSVNAHHWAHESRADCDSWSEPIGPWHLEWQSQVRPEFVEVVKGQHRADIFNGRTVIELQHSAINAEDIAARESFYGDMIWLFDATFRFSYMKSGTKAFFYFGKTKHLDFCSKPVFLDFGFDIVQVEEFTDAITMISGFGLIRSREWFADTFFSSARQAGMTMRRFVPSSDRSVAWTNKSPVWKLKHDTKWLDNGQIVFLKKWTEYIKLDHYRYKVGNSQDKRFDVDIVIDRHAGISNGWSKESLSQMREFFCGDAIVLGGLLRVLPHPAFVIQSNRTLNATQRLLELAEEHIRAGRLPVLKDITKQTLLQKASEWEVAQSKSAPRAIAKRDGSQQSLFE